MFKEAMKRMGYNADSKECFFYIEERFVAPLLFNSYDGISSEEAKQVSKLREGVIERLGHGSWSVYSDESMPFFDQLYRPSICCEITGSQDKLIKVFFKAGNNQ